MAQRKATPEKGESWRSRIAGSGEADPATLVPNPANWRQHPDHQAAALDGVLSEIGWVQQVVVNRRTGQLVDGHLRLRLALERGEPSVPVLYVDLSPAEERLVLATLDPLAAMAKTDRDALTALLADLDPATGEVGTLLQDIAEHERLARHMAPGPDEETPEPPHTCCREH